jgi:geranylgeranyl reductase
MEYHEVAVVGGGPAGSVCAAELAKGGVDVVLFDYSHPREKLCGGAISGRHLRELKIPDDIIEREINWIIVEGQHGHNVKLYEKKGGIVLMREKLDYYLFKKSKEEGAKQIKERVTNFEKKKNKWIFKTNKNILYKSDFLVGADGCPSLIRKKILGDISKENLAHCVGYHILHKKSHIEKKFGDAIELYFLGKPYVDLGYIWIFPKMDFVTIGLGTKLGSLQIQKSLEKFINNHPKTKRLIIPKEMTLHSHLLPFISSPNFYKTPITGKNWVLIGDAAGHVNSITGEGIYYAMTGGKLAAKSYLEGDISLFEKYWREKYGGDLYYGSRLRDLFYNPKLIDIVINIGNKSSKMREILADIIATRVPYDKLFKKKLVFNLPKIFLEYVL